MNFELFSNSLFKVGIDYYQRIHSVFVKRNGLVKITNTQTGQMILDNLNKTDITINNQPIQNIEELENLVYNKNCNCDADNTLPTPFKIFDLSLDETFE